MIAEKVRHAFCDVDFDFIRLEEDEALLLCSDGLSGLINEDEILDIYNNNEFDILCEKYIEKANGLYVVSTARFLYILLGFILLLLMLLRKERLYMKNQHGLYHKQVCLCLPEQMQKR